MKTIVHAALVTAALAAAPSAFAADPFARGSFDNNTMQGWARSTGASAMAYGRVKFNPPATDDAPARFGLAMTAPYRVNGAGVLLHTQAPRFADFGFNTRDFKGSWSASLNVGSTPAWSYDPSRAPGERQQYGIQSGTTWAIVGLAAVAVGVGALMIVNNGT